MLGPYGLCAQLLQISYLGFRKYISEIWDQNEIDEEDLLCMSSFIRSHIVLYYRKIELYDSSSYSRLIYDVKYTGSELTWDKFILYAIQTQRFSLLNVRADVAYILVFRYLYYTDAYT